jgi:hypothetical protein
MTIASFFITLFRMGPSKEDRAKAFYKKAFSAHMLLNLSPEQEDSLTAYVKSDERIRMEQEKEEKDQKTKRP